MQQAWRQTNFGTPSNTGNAADTFDFDNDGLSNLLEYAFGLNPTIADTAAQPQVIVENNFLTITITKQPGVTYEVQTASDLRPSLPGSFSPATTTVLINNATTLKVRDNIATTAATSRFLRTKVTSAP